MTLTFRGRSLQAALSLPEAPRRLSPLRMAPRSVEAPRLVEEPLHINPILSLALDRARRLLSVGLPVVVTGETGAGKTAFAKTVARRCHPDPAEVVYLDCATPERHAKLAALARRQQERQRTCLLVDRIDEMGEAFQTALLAALESDRQSGANTLGLIGISTWDLDNLVAEGKLRPDLMQRLIGGQVVLPPLRSIPDLQATIQDIFVLECKALGKDLTARSQSEASKIEAALRYNGGNVSLTARYLGGSRATLYRKIQKARGEVRVEA